ncbi:MAG: hypothetical protein ABEL97_11755 [Salinibacter sp.]
MSKLLKTLLLTAAATGAAALVLYQLDLEAARDELAPDDDFPGPDPENMGEEDVAMLLNELASQL